ncbi:hypothetical protein Syun_029554 [Stephania yunnanensis]|uniref:Uncharacterized protein n=1 Tax=Stephania yunnanensis TaxID=152371 RepID=A0AAP0E5K8_9MAGN
MSAPQLQPPMRRCHASPEKPHHLQDICPRYSTLSIDLGMRSYINSQDFGDFRDSSGSSFLALNMYPGNISSSTDQKLNRIISMMEHLLSSGEVQLNPAMDFSYPHNYGRYEDPHYYNVNGVGSKDLVTDLDQHIADRQRKIDEAELCSTQPTFNSEEDVSVDTLTSLEVKEDTQMEDYLIETSEACEVFQIEPEIVIALNEGKDEMNIDVNSDKPEKPQMESEEDQFLVLVQPPTLSCTFGTPYKGVEVRECLQIFYNVDISVLDEPDTIDSFVLEVPNELLNLKEGMHASLPKYVDVPFVIAIFKGEGLT